MVAITAAMPGPTGLLPFQAEFPDRFLDVGIAEQHAVTAAAGMAMAGLRPVVAVYSTFFSRAFDQANLDVGLHGLPVVFALDRAGITGDDGPSHHGVLDLSLTLSIPGMTVFAPSSAQEVGVMLDEALTCPAPRPSGSRRPRPARRATAPWARGSQARLVHRGDGTVCLLAVGKMVEAAEEAAGKLAADGVDATVWDVRVVSPPDPAMLADAAAHGLVVTVEDGIRVGGAGTFLVDAMRGLTGIDHPLPPVRVLGVPRRYIPQGKPDRILAELGLDGPGIAAAVTEALATERDRLHLVAEARPRHRLSPATGTCSSLGRGLQPRRPVRGCRRRLPRPRVPGRRRPAPAPTPRWRSGPTAWPTTSPPRGSAPGTTSASTR